MKNLKRAFAGKLDNFLDKEERSFEKAHLKAYLRGDKTFKYRDIVFSVKEKWYEEETK